MDTSILIKNARIVDPGGPHNGEVIDLLVRGGIIEKTGKDLDIKGVEVFERDNLHLSPGWLDIGPQPGEPGFEHRETLETLTESARSGGYTALVVFPNTNPVIQRKADVDSMMKKASELSIRIYSTGAVTRDAEGVELTEFMDMAASGAIAFSNGKKPVSDPGLLGRALIYSASVDKPIINRPLLESLNPFGLMHEGNISVQSGMEGFPVEAETIALFQNLSMLKYSGGSLIAQGITSASALELIKKAPQNFYAGVAAMNLLFSENHLKEFDTRFKVKPPLRSETDRQALIRGVKSGLIHYIFSNHEPMEQEVKDVEFGLAAFGASTLDTAFAMANTALRDDINTDQLVALFSHHPRRALKLAVPEIREGHLAELTLFDPDVKRTYAPADIRSKSKSNPAVGMQLYGKVLGTVIENSVNLIE